MNRVFPDTDSIGLKWKGTAPIRLCFFVLILSDKKDFCKMPAFSN
jgi:hypothetical protein